MAEETPLQRVRMHYRQLKSERETWEPHWQEVKDFIAPDRGRFLFSTDRNEVNDGSRKDMRRINGVASRAVGVLASGMQSGLTSKARQWFLLGHPDPDLNKYHPVRVWYDTVQEILEGIFRRSDIYSTFLHTYAELADFGTGAYSILSHPDNLIHCRPYTIGTYFMGTDQWGEVDTFMNIEYLTVRQLVLAYGYDKLPQTLKSQYDSRNYEVKYLVVNAILRHPEQYGIEIPERYEAASVHFLDIASDSDGFLRTSGYASWPVMTPRWDVIDRDVYGRGPTRDIIGDVRQLQAMERDGSKGLAKSVTPPMKVPAALERRGLNMEPGGLNPVSGADADSLGPLINSAPDLQQLQYKISAIESNIKEGLYNSMFLALLMQDNPQMTAREVAERHEEKLLMLGPVLERIHREALDPTIDRVFRLAWDAKMIPPPPPEIRGQPTQIEYVSILSQAQKAVGVGRIEQSVQFLTGLSTIYPEARHLLKPEAALRKYNSMIGTPAEIFRSDEEYSNAVSQEKQQQQAAQNVAAAEQMANAAKSVSDMNPASVTDLLAGTQGGLVL